MVKANMSKKDEGQRTMATPNDTRTTQIPWPKLTQKCKLKTETVVPTQILTIADLLSSEECTQIIRSLDDHGAGLGSCLRFETTNPIPKRGEAYRFNDRISLYDPRFARVLWSRTGLKDVFQQWFASPVGQDQQMQVPSRRKCWGLNPNIRIYRYQVGHRFEKHFDDSIQISSLDRPDLLECLALEAQSNQNDGADCPAPACGEIPKTFSTEYTLLIYLTGSKKNDEEEKEPGRSTNGLTCEVLRGGETVFYSSSVTQPSSRQSRSANPSSVAKKRPAHVDRRLKGSYQDTQRPDQSIVASIEPLAGLALIHRHGSKCLLHEGRQVTSGVKYVLRSDIMFG